MFILIYSMLAKEMAVMKYKYKRMIIVSCMVMMFIGMVTMSVGKSENSVENKQYEDELTRAKTQEFEKDSIQKINSLIEGYLDAQVKCDLEKLSLYVNDINYYSFAELKKKLTYVEYFDNISCYSIEGYEEDTYVVYVYREYKLENIDTLIPSVVLNYVTKNDSGEYVVYTGDVPKETNDFIMATEENPSVLDLIDLVNNKIEQIKSEDKDVEKLFEELDIATTTVEKGDN